MSNQDSSNVSNPDSVEQSLFWEDPAKYFGDSYTKAHSMPREELEALQLAGLQERFRQLSRTVPYLEKLAEVQAVRSIDQLDDVVPLLFLHSIYKSYPPALLAESQFTKINHWMNKLTAHDLSLIDVSYCERIDDWIAVLFEQSEVVPWVSSGTSGAMTLMPHSKDEMDRFARTYNMTFLQDFGDDPETAMADEVHEIWPFFRYPGGGMNLDFDLRIKYMLGGDESRFHALFPSKSSLDIRYLQAQMRLAKLEEFDKLSFSPELLEENKEFEKQQSEMPNELGGFLAQCAEELQGKRILMLGTWPMMHHMSLLGLAAGRENVFAPNSRILAGGGRKGTVLPENWREDVCRFTGVKKLGGLYGMTEGLARHMMCDHENIHFCPWVIPFTLDPDSNRSIQRKGRVTGRFAFYDLLANSHWGGLVSGDKLTIDWSEPCPCGQSSAYIVGGEIGRYADERGGKDELVPVATDRAHEAAMDFLVDFSE